MDNSDYTSRSALKVTARTLLYVVIAVVLGAFLLQVTGVGAYLGAKLFR